MPGVTIETSSNVKAWEKGMLGLVDEYDTAAYKMAQRLRDYAEDIALTLVPVDTGRLFGGVDVRLHRSGQSDFSITIENKVPYASYVEYGTYKMRSQPFLEPAMRALEARMEGDILDFYHDLWETYDP